MVVQFVGPVFALMFFKKDLESSSCAEEKEKRKREERTREMRWVISMAKTEVAHLINQWILQAVIIHPEALLANQTPRSGKFVHGSARIWVADTEIRDQSGKEPRVRV